MLAYAKRPSIAVVPIFTCSGFTIMARTPARRKVVPQARDMPTSATYVSKCWVGLGYCEWTYLDS